jgi:L-asparaginase II
VAVVDADQRLLATAGAAEQPSYLRSAGTPLQALPAIEAGLLERFALDDRHLAVMVASHSGAPRHLEAVTEILQAADLAPEALGCGHHEPHNHESRALLAAGAPATAIYNTCSGKHAGMLAFARLLETGTAGYLDPGHPVQQRITARVAEACGIPLAEAHAGTDCCSAPTLYAPLTALATGFARLAREMRDEEHAAARIGAAMQRSGDMLGEEDSFQVLLSRTLGGRLIGKLGAEGLFCAAVPEREMGIAVRVEDGAARPVGPIVLDILLKLGVIREEDLGPLEPYHEITLHNWRGTEIGVLRADVELSYETIDELAHPAVKP